MPSRRTSFLKRRMADSTPRSSTFTSRGRCRLPLSDLDPPLLSSLPMSGAIVPLSQDVVFTEHDPGLYKRKKPRDRGPRGVFRKRGRSRQNRKTPQYNRACACCQGYIQAVYRRNSSSPQPVLAPFPILMYKKGGSRGTGLPVSAAAHHKAGGYYGEYSESTIGEFRLLQG